MTGGVGSASATQTIRGLDSPGQSMGESGDRAGALPVDALDDLKNFNTRKMFSKVSLPDAEFVEWFQKMGLLHSK